MKIIQTANGIIIISYGLANGMDGIPASRSARLLNQTEKIIPKWQSQNEEAIYIKNVKRFRFISIVAQ